MSDEPTGQRHTREKSNPSAFFKAWNFIGGLGGIFSSLILVFQGGKLVEKVERLASDVRSLENSGTPTAREHFKLDDYRDAEKERRLKQVEETMLEIGELRAELRAVMARIGDLNSRLDRQKM